MEPKSAPIYVSTHAAKHVAESTGEHLDVVWPFVEAMDLYQFAFMNLSQPHADPDIDAIAKSELAAHPDLFPHGLYISIPHQLAYVVRKTVFSPGRCAAMIAAEAEYSKRIGIIDAAAARDFAAAAVESARKMEGDG